MTTATQQILANSVKLLIEARDNEENETVRNAIQTLIDNQMEVFESLTPPKTLDELQAQRVLDHQIRMMLDN